MGVPSVPVAVPTSIVMVPELEVVPKASPDLILMFDECAEALFVLGVLAVNPPKPCTVSAPAVVDHVAAAPLAAGYAIGRIARSATGTGAGSARGWFWGLVVVELAFMGIAAGLAAALARTATPIAETPPGAGTPAELRGWTRFADGREPDALSLLFFADAIPPATLMIGSSGWVPTLQMTAFVRAQPAPGWLAIGALLLRPVDERRREGDGPPGRAASLPPVTASGSTVT